MNTLIQPIEAEYRRYRALAEAALDQVPESLLCTPGPSGGNSLATICWHVSGNLRSRFTDFLDSDGEKPWRHREEEFQPRAVSRAELRVKWAEGWEVLFATLAALRDEDFAKPVQIRGQSLTVHEALLRSLAHASYHVGQIVTVAHAFRGEDWVYLSIPPGQSAAYNANPSFEKPLAHVKSVQGDPAGAAPVTP
jgi:Protein of unknown function (DUF1572)